MISLRRAVNVVVEIEEIWPLINVAAYTTLTRLNIIKGNRIREQGKNIRRLWLKIH